MAQTPNSNSVLHNNAAKDDLLSQNDTFHISDLLANDPGGAAHISTDTQFFFGDSPADQAHQADYLAAHDITLNADGSYTLGANATDFNYFVQIGNKGTWSEAHVDVAHAGGLLFSENFDGYTGQVFGTGPSWTLADLDAQAGWTGASQAELPSTNYLAVNPTSGDHWLDTQDSPGGINMSHLFTDTTAAVGGTTAQLSFDIGMQSITPVGESFEFKIDNTVVASFTTADFAGDGTALQHFDVNIAGYADAGTQHTLSLVDTSATAGNIGFAVDSIHIHDWVV